MALRDFLNLVSTVSVVRIVQTADDMGGFTSTSSISTISLCALWQNGSNNRFISDKYAKDSTHTLCMEYGAFTFGTPDASGGTVVETVSYNGENYKLVGFPDDVMQLHEITTQALERIS